MSEATPCRTYILYRHALFAQGVRSMLEQRRDVKIVGLANDLAKAATAVRSAQPDVILVEESLDCREIWPFLEAAGAIRIVTVSLSHTDATVYDPRRAPAASPSDLVEAILGRPDRTPTPVAHDEHRSQRRETKNE